MVCERSLSVDALEVFSRNALYKFTFYITFFYIRCMDAGLQVSMHSCYDLWQQC